MAEDAYEATATFGRVTGYINVAIGTLVCLLVIGFGIYMVTAKQTLTGRTTGVLTQADCEKNFCMVRVRFTPAETQTEVTSGNLRVGTNHSVGQNVTVSYDPTNPNNFALNAVSNRVIGWVLLGFGVVALVLVWVWFYLVITYKPVAAASGATQFVGMIDGAIDNQ